MIHKRISGSPRHVFAYANISPSEWPGAIATGRRVRSAAEEYLSPLTFAAPVVACRQVVRRVGIVLPAYNETLALRVLLPHLVSSRFGPISLRVYVVDDGSTDDTADVVSGFQDSGVFLIRHARNRGYGVALCNGLEAAAPEVDAVITMDADNTHDPQTILALVDTLNRGYDVAIASRYAYGAQVHGVPWRRRIVSAVANAGLKLLLRESAVSDFSSGFRAIRSDVLRALITAARPQSRLLSESGFAASLELLLALRAIGARITEAPIVLRYDRKPTASAMRVSATLLRCVRVVTRERQRRLLATRRVMA